MKFYQIETPTTRQIFDAIINQEYVPIEKIKSKAKQINILLKDYFNTDEIVVTFKSVTNTGGYPIFLHRGCCPYEVCAEYDADFSNLTDEEKDAEVELLYYYAKNYNELFNI